MYVHTHHALVQLDPREPLSLTDAIGTRLRARSGTAWVTIDNDTQDRVLEPGDELLIASRARVLVSSLGGQASVELCEPRAARRRPFAAGAWIGRLAAALGLAQIRSLSGSVSAVTRA